MTNGIPGLVVPPVFTALTLEATAEGMRIMGAELSGKKKTASSGAWFGNVLEPEKKQMGKDAQGRDTYQYILHLEQWQDTDGVIHLCKNRAGVGILPPFYADPPLTNTAKDQETAFTEFSLGKFFKALGDAIGTKTDDALKEFGTTLVSDQVQTYEAPASAAPGAPPPGSGPAAYGAPGGMTFAAPPGVATVGAPGTFKPMGPTPFATLPGGPAAPAAAPFMAPAAPVAAPSAPPSSIGGPAAPTAAPVAAKGPQDVPLPLAPMAAPVLPQPALTPPGGLQPPMPPATPTAGTAAAPAPFAPPPFVAKAPPPTIAPPAGRQAPGATQL
jgi:hypothetical protein